MSNLRIFVVNMPYEILNNRKPKLSYLKAFGCKCFVLNNENGDLGKFDPKSDEGVLVGYSSREHYVLKKRVHVIFLMNLEGQG